MLRPYQETAVSMLRAKIRERPILCMATGAGKTAVAAELCRLAHERGKRTLFLADRREICEKTRDDFLALGIPTGIILAGEKPTDAPHQVAASQTLCRRTNPDADLLIVDECHRSAAPTQKKIVEQYPMRVGLSATPAREDSKGLKSLYGTIVEPIPMRDLIEQGYLARYRLYAPTAPDLSRVKKIAGDYQPSGAVESMRHLAGHVVTGYQQHLAGRTALLFAVTREHSRSLAAQFVAAGIAAAHCDGDTPKPERKQALRDLASGALKVLTNVDLWGYGVDVPSLDGLLECRPTQSLTVHRQHCGRALRPKPHAAILLDFAGNVTRLGLPDDPVTWSLEDGESRTTSSALSTCGECFAIFEPAPTCPACGAQREIRRIVVASHDTALTEIKVSPPRPLMDSRMRVLLAEARKKGYKPRYAQFAFQRRYGYFPKGDLKATIAACEAADCIYCTPTLNLSATS